MAPSRSRSRATSSGRMRCGSSLAHTVEKPPCTDRHRPGSQRVDPVEGVAQPPRRPGRLQPVGIAVGDERPFGDQRDRGRTGVGDRRGRRHPVEARQRHLAASPVAAQPGQEQVDGPDGGRRLGHDVPRRGTGPTRPSAAGQDPAGGDLAGGRRPGAPATASSPGRWRRRPRPGRRRRPRRRDCPRAWPPPPRSPPRGGGGNPGAGQAVAAAAERRPGHHQVRLRLGGDGGDDLRRRVRRRAGGVVVAAEHRGHDLEVGSEQRGEPPARPERPVDPAGRYPAFSSPPIPAKNWLM